MRTLLVGLMRGVETESKRTKRSQTTKVRRSVALLFEQRAKLSRWSELYDGHETLFRRRLDDVKTTHP